MAWFYRLERLQSFYTNIILAMLCTSNTYILDLVIHQRDHALNRLTFETKRAERAEIERDLEHQTRKQLEAAIRLRLELEEELETLQKQDRRDECHLLSCDYVFRFPAKTPEDSAAKSLKKEKSHI